ncbi:putative PP2A regulatory subunit TAP46 [Triangularia verruculosa]|uniref:PP2A regulatory subunit TAP46 n=1 Tax=Triangularia verruculosa TaxID=2587418 RepID=A0AAN6XAQ2_9PEZI|nr:putative PP2A regulatory subunit TAP46 [Triangularia verruculosa]
MDGEPRSLKAVFADAESQRIALETQPFTPNSQEYTDAISSAIKNYQESLRLISHLSLFSPNESLEDLSTSDLPLLLINYHLAELSQKLPTPSLPERKRILTSARDFYERFLHLLDSYSLLSTPSSKLLETYTSSPTTFSTANSNDPTVRRNAKIANFQTEKSLRQKLEYLRARPEYGASEDEDIPSGAGDEEVVREVHLANLAYRVHLTFNSLDSLNREMEILSMAPPTPPTPQQNQQQAEDDLRHRGKGNDSYSDRLDIMNRALGSGRGGPILSQQGKPLQPFTLLANRQDIAKGVFRPSHNLPTMSIDEYLEEERRRGGIIEGGGEKSGQVPEPDEDNYEKAEQEMYKARAWDEFVEENPRGSGNTLNRG